MPPHPVHTINQLQASIVPEKPLSLLRSGQLLAIASHCTGGMIIQKHHYADLVGPGAAIGGMFDVSCTAVYLLGSVQVCPPGSLDERIDAFQVRTMYISKVQNIVLEPSPLKRAVLLLYRLCHWITPREAQKIPHDLIARIAGVLPRTIAQAWQYLVRQVRAKQALVKQQAALLVV
jgi:hypothetical protein